MLRWLWKIIVGHRPCAHVWETKDTVNIFDHSVSRSIPVNRDKHLCCTKCGDWKRVRL